MRDDRVARLELSPRRLSRAAPRPPLTTGGSVRPLRAVPSSHRECWCCRPRPAGRSAATNLPGSVARHDAVGKLLHADLVPAHVELFGNEHGQRRDHTLPDLAAARADDDAVVGVDAHEHAEREEARPAGRSSPAASASSGSANEASRPPPLRSGDLEELAPRVRACGAIQAPIRRRGHSVRRNRNSGDRPWEARQRQRGEFDSASGYSVAGIGCLLKTPK